jgi:hypothetical protein
MQGFFVLEVIATWPQVIATWPQVFLLASPPAEKQLDDFRLGYKGFIPNLFPSHHSRIAPPRRYVFELRGEQIQGAWPRG